MKRKLFLSTIIFLALRLPCSANFFEVPDDFLTIGEALNYSGQSDTILVHPGVYPERLILPGHDFLLVSEFYFTQDSSALNNTVIDASDFSEEDTASVLTFVHGNSRTTVVSGFTLRGGHGYTNDSGTRLGGGIFIRESHPTILSNIITDNNSYRQAAIFMDYSYARLAYNIICDNCGHIGVIGIYSNLYLEQDAIIEWNDIYENYECYGNPNLVDPGIVVTECDIIIRFNHFHDYNGHQVLGMELSRCRGECYGNCFERLASNTFGFIIATNDFGIPFRDNIFRECEPKDGAAILLAYNHYGAPTLIERNWFENIQNYGTGAASIYIQYPNGAIRENVFLNCTGGSTGGIQFALATEQGCRAIVERNHFFFNRSWAAGEYQTGSAISSIGDGPICDIRQNWFEGNNDVAVNFILSDQPHWDYRENYWGDSTGPYHPTLNPEGLGDTVGDNILFDPWLTEPPSAAAGPSSPFALSPDDWQIEPPFPNPFNSTTQIRLISSRPQPFEVMVYNVLGRRVRQLWRGVVPKDAPVSITWDGRDERGQIASTGLYFIVAMSRLPTSSHPKTVKALFLR